jgi:hypothetical protein
MKKMIASITKTDSKKDLGKDHTSAAKWGFVLALIGFVLGLIPFLPISLNGIALPLSVNGLQSSKRKLAIAGLVIAIIGLVWNAWYGFMTLNNLKN